jgi:hypothetical protein
MSEPARALDAPPLFVVGCGRSGTTLLRMMLDSHPHLAIPGESHFIPALWKSRRRYLSRDALDVRRLASDIMKTPHVRQWELPQDAVWSRLEGLGRQGFPPRDFPAVVEAFFLAYADHHGKTRWGDKTPIYVLSIPLIATLYPDARFVHVIRDGRDVALSYLAVPWGPRGIWAAARKWRRDVSTGRGHGEALPVGRYTEVRYADLVDDPERTLRDICRFADLPFDGTMLDYHRDSGQRIQSRPERTRYHASVTKPPVGGLRDWRTQMSDRDIQAFETVAGDLLHELGFETQSPTIPLRLRAEGAIRVLGMELLAAGSEAKKAILRASGRPPARIGRE